MICVSIAEETAEGALRALKGLELAEIRLDALAESELTPENVRRIFSSPSRLVATCRPGKLGVEKRKECLSHAIEAGAGYVDIEVEAPDSYKKELIEKAREKGCTAIVSYHDYKRTPPEAELLQIIQWCFDSGADIAKIACMVHGARDNARLLGLLDGKGIIVIGMGAKGRVTRIIAPLLGSPFTYASAGKGKETAEGQMDKATLERAIGAMREALGR
ncbi:MAG: type I 3-dehydroquinate dehydratase [Candidatus Micrarchaeota archaeon]